MSNFADALPVSLITMILSRVCLVLGNREKGQELGETDKEWLEMLVGAVEKGVLISQTGRIWNQQKGQLEIEDPGNNLLNGTIRLLGDLAKLCQELIDGKDFSSDARKKELREARASIVVISEFYELIRPKVTAPAIL